METTRITIKEIVFSDETYRIGREPADDRLCVSLRRFGMLRPPVLLEGARGYTIVSGFYRLTAVAGLGWEALDCIPVRSVDPEWFLARALEKEYRREIGPVGKLRLAGVLDTLFSSEQARLKDMCVRGFGIPEQVLGDMPFRQCVLGLPGPLRDYCDAKDIGYRVLAKLVSLPAGVLSNMSLWVSNSRMKVNLFRAIVDMLDDIIRRDGDAGFLAGIDGGPGDEAARDAYIHDRIFEARYPEYSAMKDRAGRITGEYSASGISVTLPRGMDGPVIRVSIDLDTRDGVGGAMKKVRLLDEKRIGELLGIIG